MTQRPRTRAQRTRDALDRLDRDVDAWVATAGARGGAPYLVPLSFLWDGSAVLIATPASSVTARNLRAGGKARLGIGPTRDLVLIEGTAQALDSVTDEAGAAFAAKTDWDPREEPEPYQFFRIRPQRLQAWREANELAGRELMTGGQWLDED